MAHYEHAFWDSGLADNEPFEKWELNGSHDAAHRANLAWKRRLAEFEAPALDQGIRDGLTDFIAERKEGMADAWY